MKKFVILVTAAIVCSTVFAETMITEITHQQVRQALDKADSSHPRLFINDKNLAGVIEKINSESDLEKLHKAILNQADALLEEKPLERIKKGRRLLSVSREAVSRMFSLGWVYRTTGDEKYLKRGEKEMLAIAEFSDWNPTHFLDVAEMTMAMGVGYDWLYDGLSENSRKIIRDAIVKKGINTSLTGRHNWWIDSVTNWNQVCHGGLACGALAIMEDEPDLAGKIIHRSVNKVQIAMEEYEPDGAYPEGPGYWGYGTTYNVLLITALDSALGTDFGLSEKNGFIRSAEYYMHATGPTGLFFNYSDSGRKSGYSPTLSWFAKKYDKPFLMYNQQKHWDRLINQEPSQLAKGRTSVMTLLWRMSESAKPDRLTWMGRGENPVAIFRTSWDEDATYLAIKGGSPQLSHGHMDIGTFVLDADGVRWAIDLGPESYHRIESMGISLWHNNQDNDRWKLFRYQNLGHNTLAVDGKLQWAGSSAPMVRYSDDGKFPHAAFDLSDVYRDQLKKAVRGASLLPSGQVLIQDELTAGDEPASVRWNMVTPAQIDIKSNQKATLRQKGKTLQFEVVTGKDVQLKTYSTKPRTKYDAENPGTRMIGFDVQLKAGEKATIQVVMTPGAEEKPFKGITKNIENWSQPLTFSKK